MENENKDTINQNKNNAEEQDKQEQKETIKLPTLIKLEEKNNNKDDNQEKKTEINISEGKKIEKNDSNTNNTDNNLLSKKRERESEEPIKESNEKKIKEDENEKNENKEENINKEAKAQKDENLEKVDMSKINLVNKEKNIDVLIKNILEEFSFLLNDYQFESFEELNNPQILTTLFTTIESNIINCMEERDAILKERKRYKKEYDKELIFLENKVESDKKELESLYEEMNLLNNLSTPERDFRKNLEENEKHLSTIYNELIKITKQKKNIQNSNITSETLNVLHQIEDKLLVLFDELDKIKENEKDKGGDGIFKAIIDKVKYDNKIEKYLESKEIMKKLEEEKNRKYQQRMNRYKIRGPIRFPPPWALQKNKESTKVKVDKKGNDDEMLYYY